MRVVVEASIRPGEAYRIFGSPATGDGIVVSRAEPRKAGIPVAHVEAGMRSFDRTMPEELNRVLADHASDLLLCSSEVAVANLEREGVSGRIELVGDVMVDIADSVLVAGTDQTGRKRQKPEVDG